MPPDRRPPAIGRRSAMACVLIAPGQLEIEELQLPETGDDDGVLRVEACGLCGTDHEEFTGDLSPGYAFVPGHESIGIIESVGPTAARRWGVRKGDRVAVEVFQSCRSCGPCRAGTYRRCIRHGLADMYGFVSVDRPPGLWGGYASHQYLAPDSMLVPVPAGLDPVVATLFNPLGAGIRWGVTMPETSPGDIVAVLGPGIRGLSVLVAARQAGAAFVLVTGRGAADQERLRLAEAFGADLTVDVAGQDPVAALRSAAGRLADVVVDVTAKAPEALSDAVRLARTGGTVVLAGTRGSGTRANGGRVEAAPLADRIVFKELRVLGALGVDTAAYRAALELLASDRYPFSELPRRCAGLSDAEDLLRAMAGQTTEPAPIHAVVVP